MDDVETTLDALEARLQALQDELGAPPAAPPRPASPDPLERFGDELRAATAELAAAYDRALGEARGASSGLDGLLFSGDVALEARADLPGLCALARALGAVDGVHGVELRAYAGGHAALEVVLDRPVALVTELQRAGGVAVAVVEARPGRLAVEIGTPAPPSLAPRQ